MNLRTRGNEKTLSSAGRGCRTRGNVSGVNKSERNRIKPSCGSRILDVTEPGTPGACGEGTGAQGAQEYRLGSQGPGEHEIGSQEAQGHGVGSQGARGRVMGQIRTGGPEDKKQGPEELADPE